MTGVMAVLAGRGHGWLARWGADVLSECVCCLDRGVTSCALHGVSEEDQRSDVYNHLASITAPLLLMHGEDDDICPLSQSLVAYRVLEQSGVPTGLVVYPKEKHGFDKPEHRQDRDRRMLCWLAQYMPSETHAELHGIEWRSRSATMPRFLSCSSTGSRWLSPPVTKPSGLMPYSSGELPPSGASMIQ